MIAKLLTPVLFLSVGMLPCNVIYIYYLIHATTYTCRNSLLITLGAHYTQLKQHLTFDYLFDPSILMSTT